MLTGLRFHFGDGAEAQKFAQNNRAFVQQLIVGSSSCQVEGAALTVTDIFHPGRPGRSHMILKLKEGHQLLLIGHFLKFWVGRRHDFYHVFLITEYLSASRDKKMVSCSILCP